MIADVICYFKMTFFMVLEDVTPFYASKMLQIHVNECDIEVLAGVLQCNGEKLKEAEDFKCVLVIYCVLE